MGAFQAQPTQTCLSRESESAGKREVTDEESALKRVVLARSLPKKERGQGPNTGTGEIQPVSCVRGPLQLGSAGRSSQDECSFRRRESTDLLLGDGGDEVL